MVRALALEQWPQRDTTLSTDQPPIDTPTSALSEAPLSGSSAKPTADRSQGLASPLVIPPLQDFAQTLAGLLAVAYLCGFVAVTAHLGRFGLRDYDAFRVQYLVAGAIVWVLIGLFAFIVGRHVLTVDKDVEEYEELFTSKGAIGLGWAMWAYLYNGSELIFLLLACTFVAGSLLFALPGMTVVFVGAAIMSGQYLISKILIGSKERLTPWSFVYIGAFWLVAVGAFLFVAEGPYRELFFSFCLLAIGLNAYTEQRSRTKHPRAFTAYSIGLGLLVISGVFGAQYYDRVRPSIGGGAPMVVRLIVDESKIPPELKVQLHIENGLSAPVAILAETNGELLVGEKGDRDRYQYMIRVKRDLVSAMSFADPRPATVPN